jgi:hypothetical protein
MDELLVALMPPRRRVSFLLVGAVSSSMLRGDSETECLLEDVVEDGFDDDDPFFLVKRLVVFFHMIASLFSLMYFRGFNRYQSTQELFWSMDFVILLGKTNLGRMAKSKEVLD